MITLIFVRVLVIAFLILTVTVTIRQLKKQIARQTSLILKTIIHIILT